MPVIGSGKACYVSFLQLPECLPSRMFASRSPAAGRYASASPPAPVLAAVCCSQSFCSGASFSALFVISAITGTGLLFSPCSAAPDWSRSASYPPPPVRRRGLGIITGWTAASPHSRDSFFRLPDRLILSWCFIPGSDRCAPDFNARVTGLLPDDRTVYCRGPPAAVRIAARSGDRIAGR